MLTFPSIAPPNIPETVGNSFAEDWQDSTISTTTDANYKITRPRSSRLVGNWDYSWVALSDADYNKLIQFWKSVNGTADMFYWTEPISGQKKIARFTAKGKWVQQYTGWSGSLSFEEV